MWNPFRRKKKQKWTSFIAEINMNVDRTLLMKHVINQANDLGLKGKKIQNIVSKRRSYDGGHPSSEIWFEGEM